MPELLIKIGENFPHKDLMLSLKTTDSSAYDEWIDREASKISAKRALKLDDAVVEAEAQWARKIRGCVRQGDIIQVRPDGTPYGKRESSPRIYRARISLSELEKLKIKNPKDLRQPCWEIAPWEDEEGEGIYYHKFGWRLTAEAFGLLKDGSIVEIRASDLVQKDRYEEYDPDKALEHNSAGTFEIKPSGGDYTDLSTWEAGEQCDLTTDGGQGLCIAECYKGDYSGSGGGTNYILDHVTIDGWTVDEDNYVKIYTPDSERHTGVMEDGGTYTGFTLEDDANWVRSISAREQYTEIDGIAINQKNENTDNYGAVSASSEAATISNILATTYRDGIDAYKPTKIFNCCCYKSGSAAWKGIKAFWGSGEVYNNTVVGYATGIDSNDKSISFKNNLCYDNTTDFESLGDAADYNASKDGTADDFGGSNNIVNISDPFNDYANDDFSLASDSTDVSGEGIGPDSDSDVPDEDIIGTSRSGSTCDIGAFEYVVAGATDIEFSSVTVQSQVEDLVVEHVEPLTINLVDVTAQSQAENLVVEHIEPLTVTPVNITAQTQVEALTVEHIEPVTVDPVDVTVQTQVENLVVEHVEPLTISFADVTTQSQVEDLTVEHVEPLTVGFTDVTAQSQIENLAVEHVEPLTINLVDVTSNTVVSEEQITFVFISFSAVVSATAVHYLVLVDQTLKLLSESRITEILEGSSEIQEELIDESRIISTLSLDSLIRGS